MVPFVETKISKYCSICMTDIDNQASTTLHCLHEFHTHCYTTYLAHNLLTKKEEIQCPLCRDIIMQIVVHSPDKIQLVAINPNSEDVEGEGNYPFVVDHSNHTNQSPLVHSNQDDDDARHACAMAMTSVIKIGLLSTIMYISFLFIQCGMGTNNMLCTS